jgi:hypothetical protein
MHCEEVGRNDTYSTEDGVMLEPRWTRCNRPILDNLWRRGTDSVSLVPSICVLIGEALMNLGKQGRQINV